MGLFEIFTKDYTMMTENEFQDFLNEQYFPVELFGSRHSAGDAIRKLDPIKFNELYQAYTDSIQKS